MFCDIDDTVRQTYGYAKQGAGRGYTGVKGLNALLAAFSTPTSAPVIAATRLRKGSTNSARGAGKLLADALATARRTGAGLAHHAVVLVRADSAYYGFDIIDACRRAGARFSITARLTKTVVKAITSIDEQAWVAIRYPNAIYDEDEQRWVSDAEIAEVEFTAFTGRRKAEHVTARLIVRRVRRLNPKTVPAGQTEAFAVYRYHAVFTDNPEPMLAAEATHRDHAIIEQVIAELKDGPLAHLPSGRFAANAAWPACAAIAYNLTRAAGVLAGGRHTRARTGTLRDRLIHTPMRVAHSAHRQDLHLPRDWPWEPGLDELFRRALHDPLSCPALFGPGLYRSFTQLLDYPTTRRELPAVCDIRVRSGFSWYCSGARCTGRCRPGHAAVSGRRCDERARSSTWQRMIRPWNYHSICRFDRPTAGPRVPRGPRRSWLTCSCCPGRSGRSRRGRTSR